MLELLLLVLELIDFVVEGHAGRLNFQLLSISGVFLGLGCRGWALGFLVFVTTSEKLVKKRHEQILYICYANIDLYNSCRTNQKHGTIKLTAHRD